MFVIPCPEIPLSFLLLHPAGVCISYQPTFMLISCIRSSVLHSLLYFPFLSLFFLFGLFNHCPGEARHCCLVSFYFLDFPLVFEFKSLLLP